MNTTDPRHEPGKIFVGGLSWETTQETLHGHFSKYGEIKDCVIMKDPINQRPRGFGFVTFEDPSSVAMVCDKDGHKHIVDSKEIDPKPAEMKSSHGVPGMVGGGMPGGEGAPVKVKKVFIGGVAQGTTKEDVEAYFAAFGTVADVDLKVDKNTNRMRGFGFVGFDDEETVEKLCQTQFHQINGKTIEVKKAQPRNATGGGGGGGGYGGRGGGVSGGYGNGYGRGGGGGGGYGGYDAGQYGGSQAQYAYQTSQSYYPQAYGSTSGYAYGTTPYQQGSAGYHHYGSQQQPDQRATEYTSTPQAHMASYGQDATSYSTTTRSSYPTTGTEGAYQQQQQQQPYGYDSSYNQTGAYDSHGGSAYGRGGGAAAQRSVHPYTR